MSRFLSTLSKMCVKEGLMKEPINSQSIIKTSKEYFSFVWKLYYEMQMPMLLMFKKILWRLRNISYSWHLFKQSCFKLKKS